MILILEREVILIDVCDELEREIIGRYASTEDQKKSVSYEIDKLKAAAKTESKPEWRRKLFGTLLKLGLELGLGANWVDAILGLLKDILNRIIDKYYLDKPN